MINNDEDECDFPHMHNFSALDRIHFIEPTPEEIQAKLKKEEALKKITKYVIHNKNFHDLMLDAALNDKDLDQVYEKLEKIFCGYY